MTGAPLRGRAAAPTGRSQQAVSGTASIPSADPSRGFPRATLVSIGRQCIRNHMGASIDAELVSRIREFAKYVTGGNCTFADEDLGILAHLAGRAVEAGLTDGLHPSVAATAAQAIEARRAATGTGAVGGADAP